MSSLVGSPKTYDSLHTLNVWTGYGNVLLFWHEHHNGQRAPYTNAALPAFGNKVYKPDEIVAAAADSNKKLLMHISNGRHNYGLQATVAFCGKVPGTEHDWVLAMRGELSRSNGTEVVSTEVAISCLLNISTGAGFCLLPDKAVYQLGK